MTKGSTIIFDYASSPSVQQDLSSGTSLSVSTSNLKIEFRDAIDDDLATRLREEFGGKVFNRWSYLFPRLMMYAYQLIRAFHPVLSSGVEEMLKWDWGFPRQNYGQTDHPNWDKAFGFQQDAIEYMVSSPHHGGLLALSPGLGKSLVATIVAEVLHCKRVLFVCPLSLIPTWTRQIQQWGVEDHSYWVVTNYDQIVRHPEKFKVRWDMMVLDESILVKNNNTKRVKKLREITLLAKRVWCLSGSPVSNEIDDLWSQFHLMMPTMFKSYWRFVTSYCYTDQVGPSNPWGVAIIGSKELNYREEFKDIMFVRHQRDVLPELPEYVYDYFDIELETSQRRIYDYALNEFVLKLESGEEIPISTRLAQMVRLQQITSNTINIDPAGGSHSGKSDFLIELINGQYVETPAIIWTHWVAGAYSLYNKIIDNTHVSVGIVTGEMDPRDRDRMLQKYREGEVQVLILSLGVGKFGLTLTNTKTVLFMDRSWKMDDYIQSLFRVQRIGLDHHPLLCVLRSPGTIDDLIEENLSGKAVAISKITNADLATLLRGLGKGETDGRNSSN